MKRIHFIWIITLLGNSILGQDNPYPEVSIASPTAAALGKYGDIPVNYHTGIPEISIPLYTINEGPLKLPISLSYHGGGVKLLETSSWVGLGWALNAGGVITRTVQGAPDEKNTSNVSNSSYGHFSDYGFNNYLYKSYSGDPINYQDWQDFASGNKDGAPDLFFFNFNGYSGKFYFSDDRTPVLVPQQDLKIECVYPGGSSSIQSFTITTPDGVKYLFGNSSGITGDAPVEITNSWTKSTGTSSGNVISSWFLNKIESADGLFAISLQYTNENYGFYTIGTHPVDGNSSGSDDGYYPVKNIINGVRLSKITTTSGNSEIDFIANTVRGDLSDNGGTQIEAANTSSRCLDKIQIINNFGFCKQFEFSYSYFHDDLTSLPTEFINAGYSITSDRKRLRLDSIVEHSCDNTVSVPPYKFSYSLVSTRRRMCFAEDYWGFNNGVDNSQLIPGYSVYIGPSANPPTVTVNGADRSPRSDKVQAGTLTTIKYPTGGSTTFDWEDNTIETGSTSSYYTSGKEMVANVTYQTSYSQTTSITITNDSHPTEVQIANSSNYESVLDIKDQSNNTLYHLVTSNPQYGQTVVTDYESLNLSGGTYTCILTLDPRADSLRGCDVMISYNWGSSASAQNISAGGLRIKTITSSTGDNTSSDVVTNYSYDFAGGASSGILYNVPEFVQSVRNDMIFYLGFWTAGGYTPNTISPNGCLTGPAPTYYISAGNLREMSSVQGSHIGYEQVTVSQPNNGKSVYHYYTTNAGYGQPSGNQQQAVTYLDDSYCFSYIPNYPDAPQPFDYKRGELYYEEHFDNSNSKLKDIFYYPYYDTVSIPATPVFIVTNYKWGATNTYLGTFDSMHTVHKDSVVTIEDDYSQGGGFITSQKTQYFGSKYHNAVTKEVTIDSKNETLQTLYKYAFDYRITSCDNSTCFATYNSACSTCLKTHDVRDCDYNNRQCVSDTYDAYKKCLNTARINYVTCSTNGYTTAANCYASAETSANTDLKPILKMQDEYINSPIETTTWRNTSLTSAQFNKDTIDASGYARIRRVQKINLLGLSTTFTNSAVNGTGLTKDGRYQDEATINFTAGNISEITNKSGVPNSYLWGYGNGLPIAKSVNARNNEIYFNSFEEGAQGDNIYWQSYMNYSTTHVHSGSRAGWINNPNSTEIVCHSQQKLTVNLTTAKSYHFSGWVYCNNTYGADIYLFMQGVAIYPFARTTVLNQWVYLSGDYTVPAGTTQIWLRVDNNGTLSSSGDVWFDDLRLYPSNAQMTTYTYSPLVGMTSQSDINDKLTSYEYDKLGRLNTVRDQDANALKKYCYNYAGQAVDCDAAALYYNQPDTAFDAKACPVGQVGTVSPYIDKAGTFSSTVSQQYADGQAATDILQKAQNYANTNGTCISASQATVTCNNHSDVTYKFSLYNLATKNTYSTNAPASTNLTIPNVPSGSYNITLSRSGDTTPYSFQVNAYGGAVYYTAGATATFYNITIGSNATINVSDTY